MPIIANDDGEREYIDRPLQVGDTVKVTLPTNEPNELPFEAPWAEVTEIISANRFIGQIQNHCVYTDHHGHDYGDLVLFQVYEDANTWWSEPVPLH